MDFTLDLLVPMMFWPLSAAAGSAQNSVLIHSQNQYGFVEGTPLQCLVTAGNASMRHITLHTLFTLQTASVLTVVNLACKLRVYSRLQSVKWLWFAVGNQHVYAGCYYPSG